MNTFLRRWQGLAIDSGAVGTEVIREDAQSLIDSIHESHHRLNRLEKYTNREIQGRVGLLNELGQQIAALNRDISRGSESSGVSELRDRRAAALDQLAGLAQIRTEEAYTGAVHVYLGPTQFVNAQEAQELVASSLTDARIACVWRHTGAIADFAAGELASLLEARNSWIPEVKAAFGLLVQTLVAETNAAYQSLFAAVGRPGIVLFEPGNTEPGSIQLHPVNADTRQQDIVIGHTEPVRPGAVARDDAETVVHPMMSDGKTTWNDFYRVVVDSIGVRRAEAADAAAAQLLLVQQLDHQREALAGLSLEDAVAGMVEYQHAEEAAARVNTMMDEAIGTVIRGTGAVGR